MPETSEQLVAAAATGKLDEVAKLIRGKADVNAREAEKGSTPLHAAVAGGQLNVVKKLLTEYMPPLELNATDAEGKTPFEVASESGRKDVVELIEERVNTKFPLAVMRKDLDTAKQLLDPRNKARPDVNGLDRKKTPLLHHVVKWGSGDVLAFTLADEKLEVNQRDKEGKTALDVSEDCCASTWAKSALKARGALHGAQVESEEQKAQDGILAAFNRWDTNGNGTIEEEELASLLATLGCSDESTLKRTFMASDLNSDGIVDYKEFVQWLFTQAAPDAIADAGREGASTPAQLNEAEARDGIIAAFAKWDTDQSGNIDEEELEAVLTALGMSVSPELLLKTFRIADANHDGKVDYKEFAQWLFNADGEAAAAAEGAMDRILAAFKKWDADENGYIGEDELIRVLGALGMSEAEVHKTFEAADLNSDGRVDYKEFVQWLFSKPPAREGVLAAFRKWDANQNGTIEEEELVRVLGALGMTESDVHNTFTSADLNKDGQVDYEEFVKWIFSIEAPVAAQKAAQELANAEKAARLET